jgi:hypothetical protein
MLSTVAVGGGRVGAVVLVGETGTAVVVWQAARPNTINTLMQRIENFVFIVFSQ